LQAESGLNVPTEIVRGQPSVEVVVITCFRNVRDRMSATWSTWLEQKRTIGVSAGVLESLARVLRLDPAQRMQLFQLALRQPVLDSLSKREIVSPLIRRLLEQTDPIPAPSKAANRQRGATAVSFSSPYRLWSQLSIGKIMWKR
jgi:hypothetical protein